MYHYIVMWGDEYERNFNSSHATLYDAMKFVEKDSDNFGFYYTILCYSIQRQEIDVVWRFNKDTLTYGSYWIPIVSVFVFDQWLSTPEQ